MSVEVKPEIYLESQYTALVAVQRLWIRLTSLNIFVDCIEKVVFKSFLSITHILNENNIYSIRNTFPFKWSSLLSKTFYVERL